MKKVNRRSRAGGNLTMVAFLFLCVVSTALKAQTQNLIPDSSFEDINHDVEYVFYMFDEVCNQWFSPTMASPDIFNTALPVKNKSQKKSTKLFSSNSNTTELNSTESNIPFSYQHPKTGNNFAGLVAFSQNSIPYKEYIAVKLTKPLVKGQRYCFKIHLNLTNESQFYGVDVGCSFLSVNDIAIYKKKEHSPAASNLKLTNNLNAIKLKPNLIFDLSNFKDTANWMPFSDNYTAKGGEEYIIIGPYGNPKVKSQFATLAAKDLKQINRNSFSPYVYYYIDDVSLIEQPDTNKCICKKVVVDTVAEIVPIEQPIIVDTIPYIIPHLNFDTDSWDIKPEAFATLDSLVAYIQTLKGYKVEVSGHTDDVGGDMRNLHLSENRAKSVAEYLIKNGVSKNIVTHKGYGETIPISTTNKDENRRVEIKLIKQ